MNSAQGKQKRGQGWLRSGPGAMCSRVPAATIRCVKCRQARTCGPHAAHVDARGAAAHTGCSAAASRQWAGPGIRHCFGGVLQQQAALGVYQHCFCPGEPEAVCIKSCHAAAAVRAAVQGGGKACIGGICATGSSALVRTV